MKTAVYIRVSTEEQAKEGFSIHAQKEKLTSYCKINDWDIWDYYIDDGISGKNIVDRPEISRLLSDVKKGSVQNVLIYKLDRLTRSVKDLISLIELFEQRNCNFSSVTEKLDTSNAVGRMFIKIIGIFAEFERENLAERVSLGYEQKTREGNYTNTQGVNGYDYIVGKGNLVVNEQEKLIVNRIYEMYLEGTSMQKIAKIFNDEKVPTKRGGYWRGSTIKSILTNPLYVGKIRYGVSKKLKSRFFLVDGEQDIIINKDTFKRVQELINKRKRYNTKKYPSENAYFSTVLKCYKCGARFHSKQQKQNDKYYITYYCNNRQTAICDCRGVSHNKVLMEFEKYITGVKLDKDINIKFESNKEKDINKLYSMLDVILRKRGRLQQLFIEEQLSIVDYQDMILKLDDEMNEINNKIEDFNSKNGEISFDIVKDIIIDLKNNWDNLDDHSKYAFINQFVKYIILDINKGTLKIKKIQFN